VATEDNAIPHMRVASWITKATDIPSEYVMAYFLLLQGNNGYANASRCHVTLTSSVLSK